MNMMNLRVNLSEELNADFKEINILSMRGKSRYRNVLHWISCQLIQCNTGKLQF